MSASRYWRMIGIDAYAGGDLELSALHLYDAGGRIDTSATLTCSHIPIFGSLANLKDNDTATTCRFAATQVRSPGFWLQWDFGAPVDLSGVRLGSAGSANLFLSQMMMVGAAPSGAWEVVLSGGRWPYPGDFQMLDAPSAGGHVAPTTFNPVDKAGGIVLSGDLSGWSSPGGSDSLGTVRTVAKATSGKWYIEFSVTDGDAFFGIAAAGHGLKVPLGDSSLSLGFVNYYVYSGAANLPPYPTFNTIGITGMALDLDSSPRRVRFMRGTSTAGPYTIPWAGDVHIAAGVPDLYDAKLSTLNAGQSAFAYEVPAGYVPGFGDLAGGLEFDDLPVRAALVDVIRFAGNANSDSVTGARGIGELRPWRDVEFGGNGRIRGTVKEKKAPLDISLRREVLLIDEASNVVIRKTWSDPITGAYEFIGVKTGVKYTVLSYDHLNTYRAVVADAQIPEVMS